MLVKVENVKAQDEARKEIGNKCENKNTDVFKIESLIVI